MKTSFDVIVIGAGVMGASIAAALVESGLDVALMEKGIGGGQGATRDTGGIVRGLELDPALRPLTRRDAHHGRTGIVHALFERSLKQTGVAYIASAEVCGLYLDAVGIEGTQNVELHASVKALDNGRFSAFCKDECLLIERNGGTVDARAAVSDLCRYISEKAIFLDHLAVDRCVELEGYVQVHAGKLRLDATWVVDASGADGPLPRPHGAVHARTIPFTRMGCDHAPSMPIIAHSLNTYLLPLGRNLMQVGGQRRHHAEHASQLNLSVMDNEQDVIERVARLGFGPQHSLAVVTQVAWDAYTDDGRPLIGRSSSGSHVYLATGFCGIGFKMAPSVAELLAFELSGLMAGVQLDADHRSIMKPFCPSRFTEVALS
ncbi:FAD-binding oxidoreductase [Pseudomonas sp. LP_7_YM]|uniref:NAD(P)/FAD-dependent oxidoreductase n=1 Tax=Pseudomonas sp. LP_7_YM TaxID=2485137 RepID=UPI00105E1B22|nr:FAD-binding oxidoreductase [Pseudomonas sp. LP_7_YM]TDV64315.1 glycine/D-amino acid oxidase-like deaminating enzyme [Pseudomonas sp. LP_7_YM]